MDIELSIHVFKWQVIDFWVVGMDCVTYEEWMFYISILELGKRIFWKICFTRHSLDQISRKLCGSSVLFIYLSSSIHSIGWPSKRDSSDVKNKPKPTAFHFSSGMISFAVGMQDRHQFVHFSSFHPASWV